MSTPHRSPLTDWLSRTNAHFFSSYCIIAAFGTYFCMYAFRKPFTAGTFEDVTLAGVAYKTVLIASQVGGYTVSKFLGVKYVSEMPAGRRALGILAMIWIAEAALLLFAVTPAPWNFPLLFLNGLPLGMVFGFVLSFLEGRQLTELLAAGLCASFIVSSGVVKSVGRWLILDAGVSEYWMPFLTGLIFVIPLLFFVYLLHQIPQPTQQDVEHRSHRSHMNRQQRRDLFRRHALGLSCLLAIYVLLTIMRSIRDDFAVEIWKDLGFEGQPSIFARSETFVMLGVVAINGAAICIRNNRKALMMALLLVGSGFGLVLFSLAGHRQHWLPPFWFMVLIGVGAYIPYVAFHTTIFERLMAAFRETGTIGYLMYLADALGYLGYVGLMVFRNVAGGRINYLNLLLTASVGVAAISLVITLFLVFHYYHRIPHKSSAQELAYASD